MENSIRGFKEVNMQEVTYLVSDTKDFDLPVFFFFYLKEIADLFGVTRESLSCMICRKQKLQRRYVVERVNLKGAENL